MKKAVLIVAFMGGVALHASCPTPTGASGWPYYSAVDYEFAEGIGGGYFTAISWGSISSAQTDVQSALGQWNAANLTQNSTGVQFYSAYCCAPLRFFAYQVNYPGVQGADPEMAAGTILDTYEGTNELASATTTFYYGSLNPYSGQLNIDPTQPNYDAFITKAELHETGHTMGLTDEPIVPYAYCFGQTAGESVMNAECGTNDASNNIASSVTTCDNQSCY